MTKLPIRVFLAITIGATGGVVLYLAQKKLAKKKSDSYASYAEVKDSQEEQEKTTNQQNWEDSVFNNPNVTILGKPGKDTRLHYIFVPPYNYEDNQEDSEENKDVQKDTEKTVEAAKEPTA